MKRILVIGAAGQIGSELVPFLAERGAAVIAAGSGRTPLPACVLEAAEAEERVNVLEPETIAAAVNRHRVDAIFNLAAILSAKAESDPIRAWRIGIDGLLSVLEVARDARASVFFPSSIGVFGPESPLDFAPQDTVMRPRTIYGISKVTGELLCGDWHRRYGVDARGLRYPGLISHVTPPGGGTTDYAVEIYYAALAEGRYASPLPAGTYLDMAYMPDALEATWQLMTAPAENLRHRVAYNVSAMSFDPEEIAASIRRRIPDFRLEYSVDPMKRAIADSWPNRMDDSCAREEWGWSPKYDLDATTDAMLRAIALRTPEAPRCRAVLEALG